MLDFLELVHTVKRKILTGVNFDIIFWWYPARPSKFSSSNCLKIIQHLQVYGERQWPSVKIFPSNIWRVSIRQNSPCQNFVLYGSYIFYEPCYMYYYIQGKYMQASYKALTKSAWFHRTIDGVTVYKYQFTVDISSSNTKNSFSTPNIRMALDWQNKYQKSCIPVRKLLQEYPCKTCTFLQEKDHLSCILQDLARI